MAKVVFSENFNYHWGISNLDDFSLSKLDVKGGKLRLTYDESRAGKPFDENVSPWSVTVSLKDLETHTPERGEYEGETLVQSGEIKSITFKTEDGDRLAKMTDIDLDAGLFHLFMREDPWSAWNNLVSRADTFIGSDSKDSGLDVSTGAGNDVVRAGPGGSYIKDGGGADKYVGTKNGSDTVSYDQWAWIGQATEVRGISADLAKGRIVGPDGKVDTVKYIDSVRGTNRADNMKGDKEDNWFSGLRGKDKIDGKGGTDGVSYRRDLDQGGNDGVKVDLNKGKATDGYGTVDRLKSIENVQGTDFNDRIKGNKKDNWFEGRDGADKFYFNGSKFGKDAIDDFSRDEGDKIVIQNADNISDLKISTNGAGTKIKLNKNSEVRLEDYFETIESSDFIF